MNEITTIVQRLLAVGLVSLLFACATPPRIDLEQESSWPEAENVIASGYRGISEKYIEPLVVSQIALNGLNGLTVIDPALSAQITGSSVILSYSGRQIYTAQAPDEQNIEQWAKLTSDMAVKAQVYSLGMQSAPSENYTKPYLMVFYPSWTCFPVMPTPKVHDGIGRGGMVLAESVFSFESKAENCTSPR